MIKQVSSFQTTDGKLHTTRLEALTAQLTIDVRGVMQANSIGKMGNLTVTDAAGFISTHATEVYKLLKAYRASVASIQAAATRKTNSTGPK